MSRGNGGGFSPARFADVAVIGLPNKAASAAANGCADMRIPTRPFWDSSEGREFFDGKTRVRAPGRRFFANSREVSVTRAYGSAAFILATRMEIGFLSSLPLRAMSRETASGFVASTPRP